MQLKNFSNDENVLQIYPCQAAEVDMADGEMWGTRVDDAIPPRRAYLTRLNITIQL